MGCLYPGVAFDTGYLTDKGKSDLIIMPHGYGDLLDVKHAERFKPVATNVKTVLMNGHAYLTDPIPIPCGHCVGCRMEYARQWKERLVLEAKNYSPDDVFFITLTYDDAHLPLNDDGEPVLFKHHLQQFLKNLRKHHGKFRYFGCGEYGEFGRRPHYHLILFGHLDLKEPQGCNKWLCDAVELAWNHKGIYEVQVASPGSFAYVCGYCEKKQFDPRWPEYPVKPFIIMSDKPGLGYSDIPRIDLAKDPHVYGNFGGRMSSFVPKAFLKKMEDLPGFSDYKDRLKQCGKESLKTKMAVYNLSSQELLGLHRDIDLSNRFQERRQDKL